MFFINFMVGTLQQNCIKAAVVLNWEMEETKVIEFYRRISKFVNS